MRRLILLLAVAGCAQMGAPPGAPPRKIPPRIVSITPDSGAVEVRAKQVTVRFDEVVSEGAMGGQSSGAASGLARFVLISPSGNSVPDVGWHRDAISIRPRHGWRHNTAYTVTLLPGISDLQGNVTKQPATVVFSTGATIPPTRIDGELYDWTTDRPMIDALVQGYTARDTSTRYAARTDSLGRYELAHMPAGTYTLRAFADAERNGVLGRRAPYAMRVVALRDTTTAQLFAFLHDTAGPVIMAVTPADSVTIRVTLDQPLDTAQTIDTSLVTVRAPDSSLVPLRFVEAARVFDSVTAAAAAAADTTAAHRAPAPGAPPSDTTHRLPKIVPEHPPVVAELVIRTARPLVPGTNYRLVVRGARNLLGHGQTSARSFVAPKPAPAPKPSPPGAPRPTAPAAGGPPAGRPAPGRPAPPSGAQPPRS